MVLDDLIVRTLETCRTLLAVVRTLNLPYHTGFTLGELFLHDSNSKFRRLCLVTGRPKKCSHMGTLAACEHKIGRFLPYLKIWNFGKNICHNR